MTTMTSRVQAWRCTRCRTVHETRAKAEKCCGCDKCGTLFSDDRGASHFTMTCDHCLYSERLRDARKQLRRRTDDLKDAQTRLAELLKDGRPAKGTR